MMVGRELDLAGGPRRRARCDVALEVEDVCTSRLRNVSFTLHRGEVLGVAGLVGAGRIRLGGAALAARSPREAMRRGIGLVPEDRRTEGLMMSMSVRENASLATLGRMQRLGFLR